MRHDALEYLRCPRDRGALQLKGEREASDGHVLDGTLLCRSCGVTYVIHGGVPRLIHTPLAPCEQRTQERFGYEWRWYTATGGRFAAEFWDYLTPLGPDDLRGKVVLDAGCGNGRFALEAAVVGARAVLAVDLSESVDVAFAAGRDRSNIHVVQANLMALPLQSADVVYSIGVLHHLEQPAAGFDRLVEHLAAGGTIAVWVYSKEGNEWFLRLAEPVRRVFTSKAPPALVKALALPAAGLLWLASMVARVPHGARARMPLGEYLRFQGRFGFGYLWLTVFDKLVAPTAYYIDRDELSRWVARPDLYDPVISFRNNTGWRVKATRVRPACVS